MVSFALQEAMIVGDVAYHDYHGIALTDEEKDALQKSIGPYNKVRAARLTTYSNLIAPTKYFLRRLRSICCSMSLACN